MPLRQTGQWAARALAVLAVLWAVAVAIHIWRAPLVGREIRAVTDDPGQPVREVVVTSRSFAEAAGGLAVGFLIGFVVVSALGAWAVWRRLPVTATAVAVAGLLLCLVTGFSIGRAFWPAAWCLLGAALISWLAPVSGFSR